MTKPIIQQKFNEWTNGLEPLESRVRIFESIRDIPYSVDIDLFNFENGPAAMLERGRGFCVPKHYLLGAMFGMLGVPVKYCICSFRWSDMALSYPEGLKEFVEAAPVAYHLYCKADIEGRPVRVDATWDNGLAKAGFPVNLSWDGKSDTRLAVHPIEEHIYDDAASAAVDHKIKMDDYTLQDKLALSRFSIEFNKWIAELRTKDKLA